MGRVTRVTSAGIGAYHDSFIALICLAAGEICLVAGDQQGWAPPPPPRPPSTYRQCALLRLVDPIYLSGDTSWPRDSPKSNYIN